VSLAERDCGATCPVVREPNRAGEPLSQARTTDEVDRDGKSAVNFVASALVASASARVMS